MFSFQSASMIVSRRLWLILIERSIDLSELSSCLALKTAVFDHLGFFFIYIKLLLKSYLTLNAGDLGSKVKIKISD